MLPFPLRIEHFAKEPCGRHGQRCMVRMSSNFTPSVIVGGINWICIVTQGALSPTTVLDSWINSLTQKRSCYKRWSQPFHTFVRGLYTCLKDKYSHIRQLPSSFNRKQYTVVGTLYHGRWKSSDASSVPSSQCMKTLTMALSITDSCLGSDVKERRQSEFIYNGVLPLGQHPMQVVMVFEPHCTKVKTTLFLGSWPLELPWSPFTIQVWCSGLRSIFLAPHNFPTYHLLF